MVETLTETAPCEIAKPIQVLVVEDDADAAALLQVHLMEEDVIEAASGYKLPVVIFTSDDSNVSKDLTLGLGAAGYLLKQKSSAAQLRQALRNAVAPK